MHYEWVFGGSIGVWMVIRIAQIIIDLNLYQKQEARWKNKN